MQRCLVLLTAGTVALGSVACELTTDLSGLQGGVASPGAPPCRRGCDGGSPVGDEEGESTTLDGSIVDAPYRGGPDSGMPIEDAPDALAALEASTTDAPYGGGFDSGVLDSGVPIEDGGRDSSVLEASTTCPISVASTTCPISVTTNTFDNSYDGYITYQNTGTGNEINPTVEFNVPNGVTLYPDGCAMDNQGVPSGITALSCCQTGTTFIYTFTGTMPANGQIALYYTTSAQSEAAATEISVRATSCP